MSVRIVRKKISILTPSQVHTFTFPPIQTYTHTHTYVRNFTHQKVSCPPAERNGTKRNSSRHCAPSCRTGTIVKIPIRCTLSFQLCEQAAYDYSPHLQRPLHTHGRLILKQDATRRVLCTHRFNTARSEIAPESVAPAPHTPHQQR